MISAVTPGLRVAHGPAGDGRIHAFLQRAERDVEPEVAGRVPGPFPELVTTGLAARSMIGVM